MWDFECVSTAPQLAGAGTSVLFGRGLLGDDGLLGGRNAFEGGGGGRKTLCNTHNFAVTGTFEDVSEKSRLRKGGWILGAECFFSTWNFRDLTTGWPDISVAAI